MRPSQEKQRKSAAPVPARRSHPVHYRLTKTEAEVQAEAREARAKRVAALNREDDYTDFFYSMLGTAIFFFVVQTLASIVIANYKGSTITVEVWNWVLPYIQLRVDQSAFLEITTWSSVTTVLLGTIRANVALVFQRGNVQILDGRAIALPMSGLLLCYQFVRHTLDPPVIDTWIFAQTMAGVVAATVIYLGFRPTGHQSASAEERSRPTRAGRESSPTQATEQRKSNQP